MSLATVLTGVCADRAAAFWRGSCSVGEVRGGGLYNRGITRQLRKDGEVLRDAEKVGADVSLTCSDTL